MAAAAAAAGAGMRQGHWEADRDQESRPEAPVHKHLLIRRLQSPEVPEKRCFSKVWTVV